MQQTRGFDPAFPPTTAPFSPPLPTDHDGPSSTASPSSSHFLPIANGHSGGSSAGIERVGSVGSANGRLDKGKGVAREVSQEDAAAEEAARQRQVERVLKRAEAAKLARTFRNRLALAGFKAQRGWEDVKLDVIEPHMEQEAARRRGQSAEITLPPPPPPPVFPQQQQQHQPQQPYAPPPQSPYAQQHQQTSYQNDAFYANSQPIQHHLLPPPPPPQQPHYAGGMDAMLNGGAHPQKRQRQEHHELPGPPNSYSNASVYAPQPQPVQHVSPYSTANVYQTAPSSAASLSQRPNKRRLDDQPPPARIGQASPRARTKSTRRSPAKNGQNSLTASDPNYPSFVDAAAALTGMARAPSDPSQTGSDEDAANLHLHHQQQQQQHQHFLGGAFEQSHMNGNSPFPPPPNLPRPSTPERNLNGLRGTPAAPGGSGGEGSNDAAAAADLMLYLAQSPSPVQPKRTQNASIGDGMATKGRRLFSGMGGPGDGDFGGDLNGGGGGLDAPFATQSPSLGGGGNPQTIPDPTKSSSFQHQHQPSLPAPSSHLLEQALAAPATPGRAREMSLNGGAASWENFINASPSPTRGGRRVSGPGGAEDGGMGHKGIGGGEYGESRAVLPW